MQTCIKRMRLDMPILNDEFVGDDEEREEDIPGSEVSTCSFNFAVSLLVLETRDIRT